ncbi:hypothetical protein Tco_0924253 [Tanacetum coccineum]|uniref:Uncharacterized protein n=1 Tax=Tanacetum coccineum TaxID=301880 RepID=A0ABQ5DAC5_9ASTR
MFSSNSTGVASSSSVRRPESKDSNSKKRVLLNTKSKSTSKDVKKSQSSVSLVSNKRDTLNLNVSESNANVLKAKTVNAVNDGSNLVCVSCGKDVFMISHDKCVARYALFANSRLKKALFTSHVAAKSSQVGATLVVAKSRFSVATPPKAMNKESPVQNSREQSASVMITSQQLLDMETMFRGEVYLTGSLDSNLYTSQFLKMAVHPTVCLVSKPRTQNLVMDIVTSLLNFLGTINHLTKQDLVDGLSKFKYDKDHLYSAYEQGKRKKAILTPKLVLSTTFQARIDSYGFVWANEGRKY